VLVRHGVPACDHLAPIPGRDFGRWVREYDRAPLNKAIGPPASLVERAGRAGVVVTSTLRRSIESAELLVPGRQAGRDSLFDEVGIPVAIAIPLALRPSSWDILARLAWVAGWSAGVESLSAARARARRVAERLAELALAHGSVMLVGHGMLNTLAAHALRKRGWTGSGATRRYWACATLRKNV
jgi:broad specificity phosphatase PhoE